MTESGFLVGTPGYMAPEQASGKRALVGPATDVYALGVMLYQLLTGQMPFQRDSTLELLRAVTSDEPTRPRRLQPRLPRDLEAITLHCLEKEPRRRYPSALELADDLQRAVSLERQSPGQELIKDHPQGVDVRRRPHQGAPAGAGGLLGGHVLRRADQKTALRHRPAASDRLGEAEVRDLGNSGQWPVVSGQ